MEKGMDWKSVLKVLAVVVLAVGAALFGPGWLDDVRNPTVEVVEKEVVVEQRVVETVVVEKSVAIDRDLVVVVPEEPPHLFWGDWAATLNVLIAANTYETLVARDTAGNVTPSLAVSWEAESDTSWIFKLREDVTFHDGTEFDAGVAAWNVNYLADPGNEMLALWVVEGMQAEALGKYELRITMPKPEPILPRLLSFVAIVPPGWALTAPALDGQEMVGTGPYMLGEWAKGQYVTLKANLNYWGGRPDVDGIKFVWRSESAVRAAMLRVGEVDIAAFIAPQDAGPIPTFAVDIPETPFLYLDPNPPLDDLRVRQALCYSIDKEALAKIFMGYATPANELVTSDVFGYNPDIPIYPYDPGAARALLTDAGALGAEITLYGRKGIYPNATEVMEAIQIWMNEAGFDARLQMLEIGAWREVNLDIPVPEGRVSAIQSSHGNEVGDAIYTLRAYYGPFGRDTWYKYDDAHAGGRRPVTEAEMVRLIDAAGPLTAAEGREAVLQEALAFHNANVLWACPMVHIQDLWGVSQDVDWTPRFDRSFKAFEASWQ